MAESNQARYLAQYGETLIDMGYNVTPIQVGEKYPPHDGWSKIKATKSKLKGWLEDGITFKTKDGKEKTVDVSRAGVGIITRDTPGVDIDVSDKDMALYLENWIHERFGLAPVRVGRAPRRLLLFRCDTPFHKVQSAVYLDDWEEPQKVEVLADGQQFVAFHIHPNTNKPYQWLHKDGPHLTPADDLPTITEAQAREICKEFERLAKAKGWSLKKASRTPALRGNTGDDDPLADVKEKTRITDEELRDKLLRVPNNDDYETWFQVGMALYHQYDGSEQGLELWHEWSESAHNYEKSALDHHWPSFQIAEKGREPLTARYIIKLAGEAEAEERREEMEALIEALKSADTREKFSSACKSAKKVDLDKECHEIVLNEVKVAFKRLTGHAIQIGTARALIRYENPAYAANRPEWLEGWVYLEAEDKFYNTATQQALTITGFNNVHGRFMLTKAERMEGMTKPESQASDAALNKFEIEHVRGTMYLPDAEPVFQLNGVKWANSYTDRSVPDLPKKLSAAAKRAVKRVRDHLDMLIADERDRALVTSWLSYVARERKRPNWALLLQGAESNGKSVLGTIMGLVMGPENVKVIDPVTMQDSSFTDWSHGACLGVIEEMKLEGGSRFDVLNKIKTRITNPVIEVHPKGRAAYNVLNTMAYLIFTNYKDSIPLTKNNTRFFPVFTTMQSDDQVRRFNLENPLYFTELFDDIEAYPGAVRQWLIEYEPHEDFDPKRRAPISASREEMVALSRTDEEETLDELLAERKREDHTDILLNATSVTEEIMGIAGVANAVVQQKLKATLMRRGFTYLGRFRLDGERCRFWSKEPARFMGRDGVDPELIRVWIEDEM